MLEFLFIMVEEKQEIKPFFRVLNTDLNGNKPIVHALLKVHGVGFNLASAICNVLDIPKTRKAGLLSNDDAKRIEVLVKDGKVLPSWMFNRKNEEVTGETKHLIGSDLKFAVDNDIKRLKRLKLYRGIRHGQGQPVRGQRTRSHFRHGRAVGVQKSKVAKAQAAAATPKKEEKGKK